MLIFKSSHSSIDFFNKNNSNGIKILNIIFCPVKWKTKNQKPKEKLFLKE